MRSVASEETQEPRYSANQDLCKQNQTPENKGLFRCVNQAHKCGMIYGYARVSTDGQSVDAQVRQLTKVGCKKVFREVASGAKTDRAQLRRALDQLEAGSGCRPHHSF